MPQGWYSEPWWRSALIGGAWGVGSALLFTSMFSGMAGWLRRRYADGLAADGYATEDALDQGDPGGGDQGGDSGGDQRRRLGRTATSAAAATSAADFGGGSGLLRAARPGWQVGHQKRLRARWASWATGVPHTRHGSPVRR